MSTPETLVKGQMMSRVARVLRRVWDYCGSDVIEMTWECERRRYATRDEVVELVLDAGRAEDLGQDAEAAAWLREHGYDEQFEIARTVFPSARYS